jgi:hypothetical protein
MENAVPDQPGADKLLAMAECMAARLCHDVAGLASTIAGMLDMALDDEAVGGGADGEAAVLATEAAQLLALRIRLYRAAWGGGALEPEAAEALCEGLPNRAKLTLSIDPAVWSGDGPGPRLLLCVLLAACAAMPAGGVISVAAVDGGGFSATLAGRHAAWPEVLTREAAWLSAEAKTLPAPMAALVASTQGWRLARDGLCVTVRP